MKTLGFIVALAMFAGTNVFEANASEIAEIQKKTPEELQKIEMEYLKKIKETEEGQYKKCMNFFNDEVYGLAAKCALELRMINPKKPEYQKLRKQSLGKLGLYEA